jgi:Mg-chelatase subunit ChlD
MTQEDIIKLAREAGLAEGIADGLNGEWKAEREFLERFAALVAAHEREACANLLLNVDLSSMDADHRLQSWTATVLLNFSDAIRARGEQ